MDPFDTMMFQVDADVKRVGWHATGVFPSEDGMASPWMYTTGLDPEIVIVGLPYEIAHTVIHDIIDSGDVTPGIKNGILEDDMRIRLDPAPEFKSLMSVTTRWDRGREYDVLQVVWPDPDGILPGEEGVDAKYASIQTRGAIE